MNDGQKKAVFEGELDEPLWAVVSFERCEASGLSYGQAVTKLAELEAANFHGLCVVTAEAAARVGSSNA